MTKFIYIRIGFFFGMLVFMAAWELLAPRRELTVSKAFRWLDNLSITAVNTVALRLLFPLLAIDLARIGQARGWGLLNNLNLPFFINVIIGVLVLDLIIYLQHAMFHTLPAFWRLHMVHHADLDIDVTTGLRFHPIEILLSMLIKMAAVVVIGAPVLAVLVFEVALNATAMFNHGNAYISPPIDRFLRLLVVTPDMHRVHHSVTIRETNSNFGFNFPWWDRMFGTYRPQPAAGHTGMVIGLSQFRDEKRVPVLWSLGLPLTGEPGQYAINSRGAEPPGNR